jgi:hypothetical protein
MRVGVVEILPLYLTAEGIFRHYIDDSTSWQVDLDPGLHPSVVARTELGLLKRSPTVVHSTSWRVQDEQLVLTYVAVLAEPFDIDHGFQSMQVNPKQLARGTATGAPSAIEVEQVVEHALRHLAWLAQEDRPVNEALGPEWRQALSLYKPEPFSAFDLSGTLSNEDGCILCTRFSRPLSQFVQEQTVSRDS